MTIVNSGSVWISPIHGKFRVIELQGRIWIHYREESKHKLAAIECREYSCYLESFIERFTEVNND
jgi:hypothetical protein